MPRKSMVQHRIDQQNSPTLKNWEQPEGKFHKKLNDDVIIDMGWGRLIFAHTFSDNKILAERILDEEHDKRDIALYLRDPHVVLSFAPQSIFLDPSHTYRMYMHKYMPSPLRPKGFYIRQMKDHNDAEAIHAILKRRHMVPASIGFMWSKRKSRLVTYLVAVDAQTSEVIGTVTGIDHKEAFDDPENGSSLWTLAVDPQAHQPGIGESLVRHLIEHYQARGRSYLDLSVMHDNTMAIQLYEKLGLVRVPVFCLKKKNAINEPLFIAPQPEAKLNIYAGIIVTEARRRGIHVEVIDDKEGYFKLSYGGTSVICRESLTELTTAIAMSRCDNKRVTRQLLSRAGIKTPDQIEAGDKETNEAFLKKHGSVVVKPARGEQGEGISVDVRSIEALENAIEMACQANPVVILEQYVTGADLRIIVINHEYVAAAVRKPPQIAGTGKHTIKRLIERQNRRRMAATGGESRIPLDSETIRCVNDAGFDLETILPEGGILTVRKTANLHTGGTIHDVTEQVNPLLASAAEKASRVLDIPVVGLDFLVTDVKASDYVVIEANERPGLANHEPQPTAEKFIDFLFPQTIVSDTVV